MFWSLSSSSHSLSLSISRLSYRSFSVSLSFSLSLSLSLSLPISFSFYPDLTLCATDPPIVLVVWVSNAHRWWWRHRVRCVACSAFYCASCLFSYRRRIILFSLVDVLESPQARLTIIYVSLSLPISLSLSPLEFV